MTATIAGPVPVVGWDATEQEWLHARTNGLGASDVTTVLGFNQYRSPWQVWAEKTNTRRPDDAPSAAADLGHDLEPWLLQRAARDIGEPTRQTEHRTYAHPEHPWRMCSPDGITTVTGALVQCKTAGLMSYAPGPGWTEDRVPLGYELQCRWEMHVMNRDTIHLAGLVAGLGFRVWTIRRDLGIEMELVTQVSDWWNTHVINRVEPPLGNVDNSVLNQLYPTPNGEGVDLDPIQAFDLLYQHRDAAEREKRAKADKDAAAASLKRLLGDHEYGRVEGRLAVTWGTRQGSVDWQRLALDLAEQHHLTVPDTDQYRRPATRNLSVKDIF